MMAQAPQSSIYNGGSLPVDLGDRCDIIRHDLSVISYKMHGFRQELPPIRDYDALYTARCTNASGALAYTC